MKSKILIVDDEELICEVTKEMVEILGFVAFTATSYNEAEKCFKSHHDEIAMALIDYNIPDSSGVEILNLLKSIDDDFIPILATGMYVKSDISKYQDMGFLEVIDKPFGMDVLKRIINKYIKG